MSPKSSENLNTPTTDKVEKKSLRTRDKFIGAGAAAALALGLAGCGDSDVNASPSPSETISAEPTATPTPTETGEPTSEPSPDVSPSDPETGIDHEGFYIPAGLSDEEVADIFLGISNDWSSAGVHDSLRKEYSSWSMDLNLPAGDETMEKYASMVAEENASKFADALLVDDWQSNPSLVEYVDNKTTGNIKVIKNNIIRQAQKESPLIPPAPFNVGILNSEISEDGSARTLEIYSESTSSDGGNHGSQVAVVSLVTVGEVEKISDIQFHSSQQIG